MWEGVGGCVAVTSKLCRNISPPAKFPNNLTFSPTCQFSLAKISDQSLGTCRIRKSTFKNSDNISDTKFRPSAKGNLQDESAQLSKKEEGSNGERKIGPSWRGNLQ